MTPTATLPLTELYLADEVAWLEETARLLAAGRVDEIDAANLQEYLESMAKREHREVRSRLRTLLAHRLKWDYQPSHRGSSWRVTIRTQTQDLMDICDDSRTLRNHAAEVVGDAYFQAVKFAADETGLPVETFPAECPYTLDELLAEDPFPPDNPL